MEKKILLISMYPKDEVPYAESYLKVINNEKKNYRIIYWNRSETKDNEFLDKEIYFNLRCPNGGSKIKKIFKIFSYARFIRKELKKPIYDKVVVLTTVPGILLIDILIKKYKNKYIYDIRDYTNEKNVVYYLLEKNVIQNSFKTIISSEGFKKFLPKDVSYQLVHNISNMGDRQIEYENPLEKENIVIGFVGNVRYEEENIKLIKIFKEDKRFKFGYWGNVNSGFTPKEIIKNNENVHFHGKFSNVDKPLIYNNVSFINAIYGNDGLEVTTALPNRLYDALIFKKPILTSKGTFLGEIVEKNGIGIAIDFNENDVYESIILYVENFNYIEFQKKCDSLLDIYLEEQHRFEQKICSFIE